MWKHLKSRWFLIGLALALLIGYTQAGHMQVLIDAKWLRQVIVAVVMFLMALPLGIGAMARALTNPVPAARRAPGRRIRNCSTGWQWNSSKVDGISNTSSS